MHGVNFVDIRAVQNGRYEQELFPAGRMLNYKMVSARPEGSKKLKDRLIAAWLVFTGQADVFYFEGGQ